MLTRLVLGFILFLVITDSQALQKSSKDDLPPQTQSAEINNFDEEKLEEYRSDEAFDYSVQRGQGRTLWERFWTWVGALFALILGSEGTSSFLEFLLYAAIIVAIIYSLIKFLGTDVVGVFQSKGKSSLNYSVHDENIHDINFKEDIDAAMEVKNYRLATRLYYLWALKLLSDNEVLDWSTSKTNADYYYEIKDSGLRSRFTDLGHIFEYAWYGGFEIDKSSINRASGLFNTINEDFKKEETPEEEE